MAIAFPNRNKKRRIILHGCPLTVANKCVAFSIDSPDPKQCKALNPSSVSQNRNQARDFILYRSLPEM